MSHAGRSPTVGLLTPGRATRPGGECAPGAVSPADRGGVPPDRPPLDGKDPMSTSDDNLYRGDAPAAPPAGWGPPPGYGQPAYGPPPGYGPPGYVPPPGYPPAYGRPTNTMAILALVLA